MAERVRLGELLVEAGIVSSGQLHEMLERQRSDGRRLGTLLIEAGLVTETQVTQILSQQLSVPWVNLYHVEFSRQLLDLVSRELAEHYRMVPLFVRRVRGLGNTLYVAMDDPTEVGGPQAAREYSGLPVRTMIAPPTDIAAAIRAYYGELSEASSLAEAEWELGVDGEVDEDELEDRGGDAAELDDDTLEAEVSDDEAQPIEAAAVEAPTADPSASAVAPAAIPAVEHTSDQAGSEPLAPDAAQPEARKPVDDTPELEVHEIQLDDKRRRIAERAASGGGSGAGGAGRFITLTLLDGTTVTLPAPGRSPVGRPAPGETRRWTSRDLIRALRAAASGEDMARRLGEEVRWESAFAALLSLLLKKHLVADWEFVEEYDRQRKKLGDRPDPSDGDPSED